MQKNKIDKELIDHFKDYQNFSRNELYKFYKKYEPDLKSSTFSWRIYDLKKKEFIEEIKKGIYRITTRKKFTPKIDKKIIQLNKILTNEFFELKKVIWNTAWLNEFTRHQTFHNFYVIEVPNELTEIVFEKLKEIDLPNVFLKPDKFIINNYILGIKEPIIIKKIITKSPTTKIEQIEIPMLEKILVDLFCNEEIFYMYEGNEILEIFRRIIKKYTINYTKLFHYARRRTREEEFKNYLRTNFGGFLKEIQNDR